MRLLASQDETLQEFFFTGGQMRWFDRQLQPGYLRLGASCARITRISTAPMYTKETVTRQSVVRQVPIRFQIDCIDLEAERARAAADAVAEWLATADFSSTAQLDSPTTSPRRHPNFILNRRAGMEPQAKQPAYWESIDVRIFNLEE